MSRSSDLSAILLIHCPDQKGLVAAVTDFISKNDGNILFLDQHVDSQEQAFFMRVEWDLQKFSLSRNQIGSVFEKTIAKKFEMKWKLHFSDEQPRLAIFVSKYSHCLYDLLARHQAEEWNAQIKLIISNHPDMESAAKKFGIDFHLVPKSAQTKEQQEQKESALLKKYKIDTIILARYMQILTKKFVNQFPNEIINIHHSFLPAFPGAKPYHSAHKRGVKIIGVTCHYVTTELDAGPIIDQDVVRVTHKDTVQDMVRKGKDLEKVVLSRSLWHHLHRDILVYKNRTVVFS